MNKRIMKKIYRFFSEKKTCEICVFWKRNCAKQCEISGTACCKTNSKFILCSVVSRYHSMKCLCNFDHHWWRKNFLNEAHVFWTLGQSPTLNIKNNVLKLFQIFWKPKKIIFFQFLVIAPTFKTNEVNWKRWI